jgi:hypothetical protein
MSLLFRLFLRSARLERSRRRLAARSAVLRAAACLAELTDEELLEVQATLHGRAIQSVVCVEILNRETKRMETALNQFAQGLSRISQIDSGAR